LQGLGATILRNTPANSVYLGTFEVLKRAAAQRLDTAPEKLPAWVVLSAAGLGGVCYWGVIFPVDCVKSAMQTDSLAKAQRRFPDMVTTAKVRARVPVCPWGDVCAILQVLARLHSLVRQPKVVWKQHGARRVWMQCRQLNQLFLSWSPGWAWFAHHTCIATVS
jgi:hypothetical protein